MPIYDPYVVYGPWLWPAYAPFYWYPPGYVFGPPSLSTFPGTINHIQQTPECLLLTQADIGGLLLL